MRVLLLANALPDDVQYRLRLRQYHIVWCPKYRRRVLVGPVESAFKAILPAICERLGVEMIESEVMPDHVHLLVSIPPPVPLGDVIRRLKGASSRNLRQQFHAASYAVALDQQHLRRDRRRRTPCGGPAVRPQPEGRRLMRRAKTPSFVAEFPVGTTPADRRVLNLRLDALRQIYNAVLDEALSRLDRMRCSLDYRRAQTMPRQVGKKPDGSAKANPERTALFKATAQRFGFTGPALQKTAERCRDACWIGDHVMSHDTQTTSLRAFRAAEAYAYGQRGRPRFKAKHRGLRSIEGKGGAVITLRGTAVEPAVHYGGLVLPLKLKTRDPYGWQAQALAAPTKYVRLVRRIEKGHERWYAQLVQEGLPPVKLTQDGKAKHPVCAGIVGADLGPSTIAVVGDQEAFLEPFCPTVPRLIAEQRKIQRAMDRSRRATNPEAFKPDRTYKKGAKIAVRSRRYQRLRGQLAETERRLAAERKRAHGELVNRTLALGVTVKIEALSYKAWQKCFGRSIRARAPGLFVMMLRHKAESAGGAVIEFQTRSTRLSQYDHRSRSYLKKPLSQRWHTFEDGSRVQRDLYSAYLARFVEANTLDARQCEQHWPAAEPRLQRAASKGIQSASTGSISRSSRHRRRSGSPAKAINAAARGQRPTGKPGALESATASARTPGLSRGVVQGSRQPFSTSQEAHAGLRGALVEGDHLVAASGHRHAGNEAVGKVAALAIDAQRLPHLLGLLHYQSLRAQQTLQRLRNQFARSVIAALQHPNELNQHHLRQVARFGIRQALDQGRGLGRLLGVVLREVAHQHIGIQPDHRAASAPAAAIAAFIASIDTATARFGRMPFRPVTGSVAAITEPARRDLHELDPIAGLDAQAGPNGCGDGDLTFRGEGRGAHAASCVVSALHYCKAWAYATAGSNRELRIPFRTSTKEGPNNPPNPRDSAA
jgi:putative transposase